MPLPPNSIQPLRAVSRISRLGFRESYSRVCILLTRPRFTPFVWCQLSNESFQITTDDSCLDDQIGTFTYHQLLQAYAQSRGDQTAELSTLDADGNGLKFDDVHLRLSRDTIEKALELSGKVTFNKHISSNASIKDRFGRAGHAR